MFPARKIKKRGKLFITKHGASTDRETGPPTGPGTSYLDVIPEAREYYRAHGPKRKRSTAFKHKGCYGPPKRQKDTPGITWRLGSGSSTSSSNDDSEGSDEERGRGQDTVPYFRHPNDAFPLAQVPSYRSIIIQIDDLMEDFRLPDEAYQKIMVLLDKEMSYGLGRDTHDASTVRMYPTYVRSIPDGTETGRFLALDLGGTNFRVLLVDLQGTNEPKTVSKTFLIPKNIMLGSGNLLFRHIAECINKFVEAEGLKGVTLPLGFTFSFPCYQEGLAAARLVRWTKGFKCEGVVGEDVVKLLQDAIASKPGVNAECVAIINDPVGALVSTAHKDSNCCMGLILGTGTNACYMEDLKKVERWDLDFEEPAQVIINTEWGAFGDNGVLDFMRNDFDREVDEHTLNPGHQLFEKMISGMYMGEIVRLVLCHLTQEGLLFCGEGSDDLFTRNSFLTKYISEIESDDPNNGFSNTKLVLQELELEHFTMDDCRHVQHVCWQVSQRAAYLAATAVATVINRMDREEVTVGVDGSLYRFHPYFHDLMVKKISQLVKPNKKFKLTTSHDGSGKGAALVAAVAQRMRDGAQLENTGKGSSQETVAMNGIGDGNNNFDSTNTEQLLVQTSSSQEDLPSETIRKFTSLV